MFFFLSRLIVILIAISAIKFVVNYVQRLWYAMQSGRGLNAPGTRSPQHREQGDTLLQKDPVCGTYVSVETSLKKLSGGQVYHFCSADCRNRFAA